MLKLSLLVKPANLDYGVVYSCSAAPEPVHSAHTIKCHITCLESGALFGSEGYSASLKECGGWHKVIFSSDSISMVSLSKSVTFLSLPYCGISNSNAKQAWHPVTCVFYVHETY